MMNLFDSASKMDDLGREFMTFMMSIEHDMRSTRQRVKKISKELDLTRNELVLLRFLFENPNIQVNELADLLGLSSSTVVIRLNDLEDEDLIERVRSKEDRRRVAINLSEKGKKIVKKLDMNPFKSIREKFSFLNESEKKQLVTLLKKVNSQSNIPTSDRKQILENRLRMMMGFK